MGRRPTNELEAERSAGTEQEEHAEARSQGNQAEKQMADPITCDVTGNQIAKMTITAVQQTEDGSEVSKSLGDSVWYILLDDGNTTLKPHEKQGKAFREFAATNQGSKSKNKEYRLKLEKIQDCQWFATKNVATVWAIWDYEIQKYTHFIKVSNTVDDAFTVEKVSDYSEKEKKVTLTMKPKYEGKDMKSRYLYLADDDVKNMEVDAKKFLEHLENENEVCKTEKTCLASLKYLYQHPQFNSDGDFRTQPVVQVNRRLAAGQNWTTDMLELKGMEDLDWRPRL